MSKYIEAAKIQFKAQIAFRFDTLVSMLFTISKIILAFVLWGAVYDKKAAVAGLSFDAMITYYIVSSFLGQLDQSSRIGSQISDEICNGRFSKYMIRPMNVFGYFTAEAAGISAFLLAFNLIAAVVWVFIFRIDFVVANNPYVLLPALFIYLLGLFFMLQLNYFIGLLAFKFLDIWVFMMIKDNIMQFITGAFIPLSILPAGIIQAMSLFPFYYVIYLPSMLLLGQLDNQIPAGFATLLAWNLAFLLINAVTYKKLRNKFDGVGI